MNKSILDIMTRTNHRVTCIGLKPLTKAIALTSGVHPVKLPSSTISTEVPMDSYAMKYYTALRMLDNKPESVNSMILDRFGSAIKK